MGFRVLMIHNRHQIRAGEDQSQAAEVDLLQSNGVEVDPYIRDNRELDGASGARAAVGAAWSSNSYRAINRMLRVKRYDIVHVQNFFPLISPSVHYVAQQHGIPVVQALRNYRLLCPAATLFREGQICEACVGHIVPWRSVIHACYRNDRKATAAVAAMLTLHNLLRTWRRKIDLYLACSEFTKATFVSAGFEADGIMVKPNFVSPDPGPGEGRGGFALFAGRLASEKGLRSLIVAWRQIGERLPLKVVGEGPSEEALLNETRDIRGIEILGPQPPQEIRRLMGDAVVVVVPSEWHEPFGRVIVEAFSRGTPVIAARAGGISELVEEGKTGFLFTPAVSAELAERVERLICNPGLAVSMRAFARQAYLSSYTPAANFMMLREAYRIAIERHAQTARARMPQARGRLEARPPS
jgi:glycosyltransferase involved in cell wall biosynthesis